MINLDDRILKEVTADQLWLLCHIAKHIGKDMSCFPSNATLCEATGWSLFKLNQVKRECLDAGLLRVEKRFNAASQASNLYFIETHFISIAVNLKGKGGVDTPVSNETPPCFISNTPPVSNETPEVLTNEVLKLSVGSNDPTVSEKAKTFPFSAFWEAYGFKKGSKSKAAEKYARLAPKDVEDIQRTLPLYLAETTTIDTGRDRSNFRPMRRHAEFYLSGRMWEAYADKAAEIEAENAKHPEWDVEYRDYLAWLNNNFPNILQLNKHLSKSQYIKYKTEYYVTGKTKLGTTLERTYLVRAHETMSTSSDVQQKYPDVFSLHCDNVQKFIKAHTV